MKLGIQGEVGSYSAEAALKMMPDAELVSFANFSEVYQELENGRIDGAVLPFENTIIGSVSEQYDLLGQHEAEIEQECVIPIEHQVIGLPGAELQQVREIFSHPVALQQCRRFFARNPQIAAISSNDTAGSVAQIMAEGNPAHAAIASRQAALHYRGQILQANMQDDSSNCTRFWLLRRRGEVVAAPGTNKISLLLELPHRPAALANVLAKFADLDFNLTRIESRPITDRPFHYHFFADFERATLTPVDMVISALRTGECAVRVLGRYHSAQPPTG
jgi:prephenate dehydratase